ncbi:MAG TPA: restriction endonuclease [Polyangiaceae bacterium]|jgi:restriction system protein|nr:restriction endonuclease [Polyangiaceae bacterium]
MIVVVAALFLGLLLIALLSRFARNVPRVDTRAKSESPDGRPPIPPPEFERTLRALLPALGLEIIAVSTDENGTLDMMCRDPRPITGGRLLVRASPATVGGQVDAAEVLAFAESVRADMGALKGIDIAVAGFTDEAYAAVGATPALIELIDGSRLIDLVREYVPERVALLERYRSFSAGGRRHSRAAWSSEAGLLSE